MGLPSKGKKVRCSYSDIFSFFFSRIQAENPIFKPTTTTFQNPMYGVKTWSGKLYIQRNIFSDKVPVKGTPPVP